MSDTISRAAAIDIVKKNTFRLTFAEEQNCEGRVAWSADAVYSDVIEGALLELPSAQPNLQPTCNQLATDCISRQAAIDALREEVEWEYDEKDEQWYYIEADMAIGAIERLSSAQLEERTKERTETHACDLIKRQDAIDAAVEAADEWDGGYSRSREEIITLKLRMLPSADRPTDKEDQLKFYYVESIDDYWIGMRTENFYYADWHEGLGFVWSHSRYLPWGEHVVDENTLWKEHTYPSEPVEIPFTHWIVGFVKKYFADRPTGEWIPYLPEGLRYKCSECESKYDTPWHYCQNCGSYNGGESDDKG